MRRGDWWLGMLPDLGLAGQHQRLPRVVWRTFPGLELAVSSSWLPPDNPVGDGGITEGLCLLCMSSLYFHVL
jgi:hypothetical protein